MGGRSSSQNFPAFVLSRTWIGAAHHPHILYTNLAHSSKCKILGAWYQFTSICSVEMRGGFWTAHFTDKHCRYLYAHQAFLLDMAIVKTQFGSGNELTHSSDWVKQWLLDALMSSPNLKCYMKYEIMKRMGISAQLLSY